MRIVMMFLVMGILPFFGICQDTNAIHMESLLTNMVGTWTGQGKYMDENRNWIDTRVDEIVESKLNGLVLTFEGKGFRLNDTNLVDPIHHAFGLMHVDQEEGTLKMRAILEDGRWVDPHIKLTDQGFNWSFEVPGGVIRYQVVLTDDQWMESGYFCRSEEKWPFFEMELTKQTED